MAVAMGSGVGVGLGVNVAVGKSVEVGAGVAVAVGSNINVGVGVGASVGSEVAVGSGVAVGVSVGVNVGTGAAVAVGIGGATVAVGAICSPVQPSIANNAIRASTTTGRRRTRADIGTWNPLADAGRYYLRQSPELLREIPQGGTDAVIALNGFRTAGTVPGRGARELSRPD